MRAEGRLVGFSRMILPFEVRIARARLKRRQSIIAVLLIS
jgi:hypothetical protein